MPGRSSCVDSRSAPFRRIRCFTNVATEAFSYTLSPTLTSACPSAKIVSSPSG